MIDWKKELEKQVEQGLLTSPYNEDLVVALRKIAEVLENFLVEYRFQTKRIYYERL